MPQAAKGEGCDQRANRRLQRPRLLDRPFLQRTPPVLSCALVNEIRDRNPVQVDKHAAGPPGEALPPAVAPIAKGPDQMLTPLTKRTTDTARLLQFQTRPVLLFCEPNKKSRHIAKSSLERTWMDLSREKKDEVYSGSARCLARVRADDGNLQLQRIAAADLR